MTMTATQQQTPGFLNVAPDNWKLAIAFVLAEGVDHKTGGNHGDHGSNHPE